MFYNTSDFKPFFQEVIILDISGQKDISLKTYFKDKRGALILKNTVENFPQSEVDFANETIGSGNFVNPFKWTNNKTFLFQQGTELHSLESSDNANYLLINSEKDFINP
jgi:hypothetical protein